MAAIRDGLADLAITDGRRSVHRLDRIGFTFDDGATALVHRYPIRGGRAPGELEIIVDVLLGGGELGRLLDARMVAAGHPAATWVVTTGCLHPPGGGRPRYEIRTDADVAPVAAAIVSDVRMRFWPVIDMARNRPAEAAALVRREPWLAGARAADVAEALDAWAHLVLGRARG